MDGKMAVLPSDSDYRFPPRFFFESEGKKKTNKLDSGEVGRRSYVITQKKNDPPLALKGTVHKCEYRSDSQTEKKTTQYIFLIVFGPLRSNGDRFFFLCNNI